MAKKKASSPAAIAADSRRRARRGRASARSQEGARRRSASAPAYATRRARRANTFAARASIRQPITGAETAADLIDNAFLAYNAARLREACQLFTTQDARARRHRRHDAHRRAHAGRARHGGAHSAHRERLRRLDHLDGRESLPRHALRSRPRDAPRQRAGVGRRAARRRASCASTTSSSTTTCCCRPTRSSARSSRARSSSAPMSSAEFHYLCGKYVREREKALGHRTEVAALGGVRGRRADLHVVARRLVDRHERRRAGARGEQVRRSIRTSTSTRRRRSSRRRSAAAASAAC